MNDIREIWSLPWHLLQRNLAEGILCPQTVTLAEQDRDYTWPGAKPMSSLEFDFVTQMSRLELEWRQAYDSSMVARADYQILAASPKGNGNLLGMARERLDRAEALQARIMAKIERLEDSMLGQD
jgi:hypothetical protein